MLLQVALLHLQTTKRATARSSSSPSAQSIARWRTDACSGSADIRRVRSQRMSGTRCSEQPEATSGRAPRCPFDDAFRYATARVVPPRFRAASTRATSHRSLDCSASGSSPTGAPGSFGVRPFARSIRRKRSPSPGSNRLHSPSDGRDKNVHISACIGEW